MSKNYETKSRKTIGRGRIAELSVRTQVRNFIRSAVQATDPNVFYFSLNGLVMPLSRRV